MDNEKEIQSLTFVTGMLLGAAIGAGVALLMAPASGRKTRRRLVKQAEGIRGRAADRWEEVTDEIRERVDEALTQAKARFP
jgi:gas vesicle protein